MLPGLAHVRIFGSKISSWILQDERKSKLSNKAWTGRYAGHADNDSTRLILDKSTNLAFPRGQSDVRECLTSTDFMSSNPESVLDHGSCIDYFVQLPQPFQDSMSTNDKAQLMTHTAMYDAEDHETLSITSV